MRVVFGEELKAYKCTVQLVNLLSVEWCAVRSITRPTCTGGVQVAHPACPVCGGVRDTFVIHDPEHQGSFDANATVSLYDVFPKDSCGHREECWLGKAVKERDK